MVIAWAYRASVIQRTPNTHTHTCTLSHTHSEQGMKLRSSALVLLASLAGLAAAQELPACPVTTNLKAPAKPVVAGRIAKITLAVQAQPAGGLSDLNVGINLPSNCCVVKSRVRPSLRKTTIPTSKAPIAQGQNIYWLDFPLSGKQKGRRLFSLKIRVSSLYTAAATVPITATVYVTNATGISTCATTVPPASVSHEGKPSNDSSCVSRMESNWSRYVISHNEI